MRQEVNDCMPVSDRQWQAPEGLNQVRRVVHATGATGTDISRQCVQHPRLWTEHMGLMLQNRQPSTGTAADVQVYINTQTVSMLTPHCTSTLLSVLPQLQHLQVILDLYPHWIHPVEGRPLLIRNHFC
eukprot:GHUV01025865.1.p4 GENE.GHUV01025865.1~~GHUV01025865.1.p4  ORF type:complete len:128 (+),score=22.52 GHUV01025865.1:762-1145(+)